MEKQVRICRTAAIVLGLLLLFVVPVTVNFMFSTSTSYDFLQARFDAGSLLSYIATVLVGIGTISLSYFAMQQSKQIERVRQEMQRRQDEFERENTKRPFFVMDNICIGNVQTKAKDDKGVMSSEIGDNRHINIYIKNVGDGPACQCRTKGDAAFGDTPTLMQHRLCIPSGEIYTMEISLLSIERRGSIPVVLRYENIVGTTFQQSFTIALNEDAVFESNEIEIEEGLWAYEQIDKKTTLRISSFTPQTIE